MTVERIDDTKSRDSAQREAEMCGRILARFSFIPDEQLSKEMKQYRNNARCRLWNLRQYIKRIDRANKEAKRNVKMQDFWA